MKKQRIIRWGLIGLGAQGTRLAASLKKARMPLAGVASANMRRSEEFSKDFSTSAYTWSGLLKEPSIDAVCIATPNHQHAKQAVDALRAGKHVFCEKPLALTAAEGRSVKSAVRISHKKCAVGFHLRMHPAIQEIRKLVTSGKLGDVCYIDMHWSIGSWNENALPPLRAHQKWRENIAQSGGGALMARGVHLFDMLRFITNLEVSEIRSYADAAIDRTTMGIVLLNKKIPAVVVTSKILPGASNHISVYGTRGSPTLLGDFSGQKGTTLQIRTEKGTAHTRFSAGNLYARAFSECALLFAGRPTLHADVDDGIAAIQIAEAWKTSARSGKSVKV